MEEKIYFSTILRALTSASVVQSEGSDQEHQRREGGEQCFQRREGGEGCSDKNSPPTSVAQGKFFICSKKIREKIYGTFTLF